MTVTNLLERWERFWFEDVPSETFALLRIAMGSQVSSASSVSCLSTSSGRSTASHRCPARGSDSEVTFWSPASVRRLDGSCSSSLAASFICMTVGLFSGAAVVTCFLGSVFQARWNSLPLTSGHTIMVAVLFCLLWADCGRHLSVDAWRRGGVAGDADDETVQPIWPLRLIRAQVAVLYLSSGFFKLLGAAWRDGSAAHYTTSQNVYGRIFHVYAVPANFEWTFTLLTYLTVAWELAFPFLLWNRTNTRCALVTGVGMHLGIWATMEVGPFSWVMLASYVAFLDPHTLSRYVRQLTGSSPDTLAQLKPAS